MTVRDDSKTDDWQVVNTFCSICGKRLAIVATTASIDGGYCESMPNGRPVCPACAKGVVR